MRHERGEGEGEGPPNKDGLLSPTLSSIVPLAEREQAPGALKEEFFLTPNGIYTSQMLTPCLSEARASERLGMNSCATWPLKPVSTIAFIMAG